MDNQVLKSEKHERCKKLITVFEKLENNYYKENVGNVLKVIPETYLDGYLTGHTDNYIKVKFKGCKNFIGKVVDVKIESIDDKIALGKLT